MQALEVIITVSFISYQKGSSSEPNELPLDPPLGYQVRIRASKTDPFRIGATIHVTPTGDPSLYPVTVLDSLVSATGQREGPLFHLQNGVSLSRPRLNRLVRELAARSGAPTNYSSHSFRIRAASAAAAAGIPRVVARN